MSANGAGICGSLPAVGAGWPGLGVGIRPVANKSQVSGAKGLRERGERKRGRGSLCLPQRLLFLSSYLWEQVRVLAGCSFGLAATPQSSGSCAPLGARLRHGARGRGVPEQRPASSAALPLPAHSRLGHVCGRRLQVHGERRRPPAASGQRCAAGAASPSQGLPGAAATRAAPASARAEAGRERGRRLGALLAELRGGFTLPGVVLAWAAAPCALQASARGSPGAGTRGCSTHLAPLCPPGGREPPALHAEAVRLQEAK